MTLKSLSQKLVITGFLLASYSLTFAQVKSIGIVFSKRGYIEKMTPQKSKILMEYIMDNEIQQEILNVNSKVVITNAKGNVVPLETLKSGMSLMVDGESFKKGDSTVAIKMKIIDAQGKTRAIDRGRLDIVIGEYAFVDGNKVTLAKGVKIKGVQGYKGKNFNAFNELVLGDLIKAEGSVNPGGYLVISKAEVQPDLETKEDKKLTDFKFKEQLLPIWSDKSKRNQLLGMTIPSLGRITDDATIQDYVAKIGNRLIPPQLAEKNQPMFFVITSDQWNAYMRTDGICVVFTGLLKTMHSEADLAAVLGHEITHVYYEHSAMEEGQRQEAEAKKKRMAGIGNVFGAVVQKVKPTVYLSNNNKVIDKATMDTSSTNALFKLLPAAVAAKHISSYSMEEESQADRVGLSFAVNAGYDPRNAPVLWRDHYNDAAEARENNTNKEKPGLASLFSSAANNTNDKSGLGALSFSGNIIGQLFNRNLENIKANSVRTHPEDIKRFEALNGFIDSYYSEDALLANAKQNQVDDWNKVFAGAEESLRKDKLEWYMDQTDDPNESIKYIGMAITAGLKPQDVLYYRRGLNYALVKNYKNAIADLNQATKLNNTDKDYFYLSGYCKEASGKSLDAIVDFTKAITLAPDTEQYYISRAASKESLSKHKEAIVDLSHAITLNTHNSEAYFKRADVYFKLADYKNAMADYTRVTEIDPGNSAAANNIDVCEEKMKPKPKPKH
jgi:predicted Zn-dependent protease